MHTSCLHVIYMTNLNDPAHLLALKAGDSVDYMTRQTENKLL